MESAPCDGIRVSVIIATYNDAELLPATIASVRAQTLQAFDCWIADDGSTDATPAIAQAICAEDTRFHYQRLPHSGGPAAGRNWGIAQSTAEYVTFLDSDDLWEPTRLARLTHELDTHPDCDVVYHDFIVFDHNDPSRTQRYLQGQRTTPSGNLTEALYQSAFANMGSTLFRRSCFTRFGGMAEDTHAEDYELLLRLAPHVRFAFVPEALTRVRRNRGGRRSGTSAALMGVLEALERIDNSAGAPKPRGRAQRHGALNFSIGRALLWEGHPRQARRALWRSLGWTKSPVVFAWWLAVSLPGGTTLLAAARAWGRRLRPASELMR